MFAAASCDHQLHPIITHRESFCGQKQIVSRTQETGSEGRKDRLVKRTNAGANIWDLLQLLQRCTTTTVGPPQETVEELSSSSGFYLSVLEAALVVLASAPADG